MQLCIDQGNSCIKAGIFDRNELVDRRVFRHFGKADAEALLREYAIEAGIYATVAGRSDEAISYLQAETSLFLEFSHETPIPITNGYATPHTLGLDRLAGVIGANFLQPESDLLVIDAGSAITYDFVDAQGVYRGGSITPGLDMRLRALHEYTRKLPLVKAETESRIPGNDTVSSILSGVLYGIVFEIDGYIQLLKEEHPRLSTFLTGGSTFYFANKLKSAIFADENLILTGLNRILQYNNVQK